MFAWGPAALWAVVLFLLSSIPGSAIGGISVSDLFIHTCVYSVLGAALVYGRWKGSVGWPHGLLIAAGVLYGASDEWHQSFVPGRYPAVSDWIADAAGIVIGYMALYWWLETRRTATETTL
jgi:VanZ family protein